MYRALVVDDTSAEIECIQFLIRKAGLDLDVKTAPNGRDALALFAKEPFDILLTDIKMPFMDGLMLSREARKLDGEISIVLFSGYNEFEYAKTAISIGVTDYLMKPIDPEAFIQTVRRVMLSIKNRRQNERESAIVRRHMIWMLLNQDGGEPDFSLPAQYEYMMILEFASDFFGCADDGFEAQLRKAVGVPFDYIVLYPVRALMLFQKSRDAEAPDMQKIRRGALEVIERESGRRCLISFERIEGERDFRPAYLRLESQVERTPVQEKCAPDAQQVDGLMDAVHQGDIALFRKRLDALIELADEERWPESYVKYALVRVTLELMQLAGEHACEADVVSRIYRQAGYQDALGCVARLCADIESREENLTNRSVETIKQYIYRNYDKDLGLSELSEAFYFSPSYLCHVFKRETGCNLVKFINDYRMKKAQEILAGTSMKINAVAQAVGYKSASYFCQRFRDCFGVSPEQFRQNVPVGR